MERTILWTWYDLSSQFFQAIYIAQKQHILFLCIKMYINVSLHASPNYFPALYPCYTFIALSFYFFLHSLSPHLHLYLSHSIPSFFSLPYSCGILFLAHTHTCTHSCTHSHDYLKCTLTKQNCIAIPAHLLAGGPSHVYLSVMWSSLAQKEQEIYTTRGGEV